ncbi:MAG: thymidine kinase, partial [Lachnospiraceae bacterium]|nr:thymidine kinase [Lachnospiraceae bacterium]
MAKLYFRYGAMGSSKTANALMVHYNYIERGLKALLLKPKLENRDGESAIKSRIGLEHDC